jgi:hypothetical protein
MHQEDVWRKDGREEHIPFSSERAKNPSQDPQD